jgi:L-amino acid N-acyltransferase YncA
MTRAMIRPAAGGDVAAITAIYRPAVLTGTASFELDPPAEAEMLSRFHAVVDAGYPYLVAELEGRVAGYAYANAHRPRPAYRFTVEDSVYVAPDLQGKGVGGALLSALIAACTLAGFRLMVAVIGDASQHASIALHRRAGFAHCGSLHAVGHKFGRWLDTVLMELPLGEGSTSAPADRPAQQRGGSRPP